MPSSYHLLDADTLDPDMTDIDTADADTPGRLTLTAAPKLPLVEQRIKHTNISGKMQKGSPIDVEFGVDLEADVGVYVSNAASENKTGRIRASRVTGLRRELFAELERAPSREAFAAGLRAANAAGAANRLYVRKAAMSYATRPTSGRRFTPPSDGVDYDQGLVVEVAL